MFFRITIKLRSKKTVIGIRELSNTNIDAAWLHFRRKAYKEYSEYEIISFEVVQVSKHSEEVKKYLGKDRRPLSDSIE